MRFIFCIYICYFGVIFVLCHSWGLSHFIIDILVNEALHTNIVIVSDKVTWQSPDSVNCSEVFVFEIFCSKF